MQNLTACVSRVAGAGKLGEDLLVIGQRREVTLAHLRLDQRLVGEVESLDPRELEQGVGLHRYYNTRLRAGTYLGAAAGAISGNSGSKGAKTGAGVGVVAAGARNARNRRDAKKQTKNELDTVVKNCMRGRGYNVLN